MEFEQLPKETQELLDSVMSTPEKTVDIGEVVTTEGVVPEDVMEAEGTAPEVSEIPKSTRSPKPRPT